MLDAPRIDFQGSASSSPAPGELTVAVALSHEEYASLYAQARRAGLRTDELIRQWVKEQATDSAVGPPVSEKIRQANARIGVLENRVAAVEARLNGRDSEEYPGGSGFSRGLESGDVATEAKGNTPLHEEIMAVLKTSERGMTAREIAAAVKQRGHYVPRTRPLDATVVTGRVSHANYRHLFRRDGRLIEVADAGGANGR